MFFIIFILFLGYNKIIYNSEPPATALIEKKSKSNSPTSTMVANNNLNAQTMRLLAPQTRVVTINHEDTDRKYYTDNQNINPLHKTCLKFMGGCTMIVLFVGGIITTINHFQ